MSGGLVEILKKATYKESGEYDRTKMESVVNEFLKVDALVKAGRKKLNSSMMGSSRPAQLILNAEKLKLDALSRTANELKNRAIELWKLFPVVLPPDEFANWEASLKFDYNKPGDFRGIANPYYTNYTFLRTMSRLPTIEFIKYSTFVEGPNWPLVPRIGDHEHEDDPDYIKIFNEIDNTEHEFKE